MTPFVLSCALTFASAQIWNESGFLYLRYDAAGGAQNFPIYEGVVTAPMLPGLKAVSDLVNGLDGHFVVRWPENQCQISSEAGFLLDCSGTGEITEPATSGLVSSGLATSLEHTERVNLSYDRLKIHWIIEKAGDSGPVGFVTFPFNSQQCSFKQEKAQPLKPDKF